jgi:hypothetical protein
VLQQQVYEMGRGVGRVPAIVLNTFIAAYVGTIPSRRMRASSSKHWSYSWGGGGGDYEEEEDENKRGVCKLSRSNRTLHPHPGVVLIVLVV